MDSAPVKKSLLVNLWLAIVLTPFAIGFVIAACLAGGPSEVFKALAKRK